MSIKLHPRYFIVAEAKVDIGAALALAIGRHDLTHLELIQILTLELTQWIKYSIRAERHPDDPEKKGDEE